jgi:putative transposase
MRSTEFDHPRKAHHQPPTADGPSSAERASHRRNGTSTTTVRGPLGPIPRAPPRDRNGTVEPKRIPKHPRRIRDVDETILALSANGMTTRDRRDVVPQRDGGAVSATLVTAITADRDAEVTAWRTRSLDAGWPIASVDGIGVPVRGATGRVSPHTVDGARGVHLRGRQELRGRWRSETAGATFGRAGRTDRKSRGRKDLFVAGIDGRSGFAEAIPVAAPEAEVQGCLVHRVRAARRYVAASDARAVLADRKKIDRAATRLAAEGALAEGAEVGDGKDPTIAKRWRPKWPDRVTLFAFPEPIRKARSTTNAIERVHRVIRTFTRNRQLDPNGDAAIPGGAWPSAKRRRRGRCRSPTGNRPSTTSPSASRGECPG